MRLIFLIFSLALLLQLSLHPCILPNLLPFRILFLFPPFLSALGILLLHSLLTLLHISVQGFSRFSFPCFFLVCSSLFLKSWFLACPAEGGDDLRSRKVVLSQFEFANLFNLEKNVMGVVSHFKIYLGLVFKLLAKCETTRREIRKYLLLTILLSIL